jgi:hypothetical protein
VRVFFVADHKEGDTEETEAEEKDNTAEQGN